MVAERFTDSEMLDWLSEQTAFNMKYHYEGEVAKWNAKEKETQGLNGNIDFFSCPSQHLKNVPSLREAIQKAMEMDLAKKLVS